MRSGVDTRRPFGTWLAGEQRRQTRKPPPKAGWASSAEEASLVRANWNPSRPVSHPSGGRKCEALHC